MTVDSFYTNIYRYSARGNFRRLVKAAQPSVQQVQELRHRQSSFITGTTPHNTLYAADEGNPAINQHVIKTVHAVYNFIPSSLYPRATLRQSLPPPALSNRRAHV